MYNRLRIIKMFVLGFIEHLHLLATQIPLEGKFTQSLSVIIEFTATLSYNLNQN